jgi:hypothetical protein
MRNYSGCIHEGPCRLSNLYTFTAGIFARPFLRNADNLSENMTKSIYTYRDIKKDNNKCGHLQFLQGF